MEENKHLQLIDTQGVPFHSKLNNNTIIFSHQKQSLIYSLGSNIIYYNLPKNSKTFLQYFSSDISLLKFLDNSDNILLIITNAQRPILSLWYIPSFIGIYSQEISTGINFQLKNNKNL